MRSAVSRFFISLLPVLLVLLLLRFSISLGFMGEASSYDWRLPTTDILLERFSAFDRIRRDMLNSVNWINSNFTAFNNAWSTFPEINSIASFFQAVGHFFVAVGHFFAGVGSVLVLIFHVVITPIRVVVLFFYSVLA